MKLPFLQFYPADYMRDTRALSLAAKGGWVDVMCMLHGSSTRGTMKLPLVGWARVMGSTVDQADDVVRELEIMGVCDVIRGGNGDVTISSRRMLRESITKEQTRLRVARHRSNADCNAGGNADVTDNKSEVRSQKLETKKSEDQSIDPSAPPPAPLPAESIYQAYPRKQGKADALKAIEKAIKAGHAPERLLERTQAFATATALWPEVDRNFIPHPATWFNRGSYDDDPATWERKTAGNNRVGTMTAQDHAHGF